MLLLSFLLSIAAISLFAAVYVMAAWRIGAAQGVKMLPVVWVVGALAFWILNIGSRAVQGLPIGFPPNTWVEGMMFYGFLAYGIFGAGLATLSVKRRLIARPGGGPSAGAVSAGVGAFLVGMLIPLVLVLITDLSALFGRMF